MARADFSAIIHDFLTAELGEDVRDSLVAIAEALEDAINTQIYSVTTDPTTTDPNAAVRASVIGDFMSKTPYYIQELRPGTAEQPTSLDFTTPGYHPLNVTDENRDGYDVVPAGAIGYCTLLTLANRTGTISQQLFICPLYGSIWTRRKSGSGWSSWRGGIDNTLTATFSPAGAAAVGARFETAMSYKGALGNANLDDLPGSCIYSLNVSGYSYQNLPDGASGVMYLMTYGVAVRTSTSTGWQILVGSTGRLWQRRFAAGRWNDWYSLDDRIDRRIAEVVNPSIDTTGVVITADNKSEYFTDMDNAPLNTIFRISSAAKLDNSPYGDGMSTAAGTYDGTYRDIAGYCDGTLMTYGAVPEYKQQIFVSGKVSGASSGRVPPNNATMFFRTFYIGASPNWGEWHAVSNWRSPTSTNIAIRKKFIAPWLDNEGNPTATDTGVPNPQYIADDPRFFNDFDDAPFNSIYQIDLDNDATVMANNPRPGKSSVLFTSGFSWSGMQHGKVQLCVGIDTGTTFAYLRYGYIQSASQGIYIWTPWLHLADADEVDALRARVSALEAQVAALGG